MDASARVTSKGQVTIPKAVRDALALETGDRVVFRVEQHRAIMARTPDLLELAGTVEVPAAKRGADWGEVRLAARNRWAHRAR
ncbi:MAG: AbrB/MazE/SpoVT family DNA-binding domain-containing protein [Acidimicrobiia bacterium]|nr:AbrB/MazE/SpoVT family DNA-binding domain-containing protein [Acidimicrobiia bacterium]